MLSPERLLDIVGNRLLKSSHDVSAYWIKVEQDRDGYAQRIFQGRGELPVIPMVVREQLFENPNAILSDLIDLIIKNRDIVEQSYLHFNGETTPHCALILLSRGDLCVPQASSPVTLPDWFPFFGGRITETIIEDLTWSGDAPLNAEEVKIPDVCVALYELERVLLKRLDSVHKMDHSLCNGLLELMRKNNNSTKRFDEILEDANAFHTKVRNPAGFRPSIRYDSSLLAQLWQIVNQCTPDQLGRPSKFLAGALGIPKESDCLDFHESIFAVISRPSAPDDSIAVRFARNALTSIAGACQLVTAAAHADGYYSYPVVMLKSISADIRRSLNDLEKSLLNM